MMKKETQCNLAWGQVQDKGCSSVSSLSSLIFFIFCLSGPAEDKHTLPFTEDPVKVVEGEGGDGYERVDS